ncbi:phosphotransferase family protein [Hoyosella subflava]|uniref:Aminoglycoside phosphotransferase n=1 Tax=Hoyosella subflava (strain DSM 45089 / JCM 17490 / NBRC 109087 / DQS3-9A1) TaxID=443218 RepID=F6EJV5_HOYSD|nr:phosphotransferase family protein [Hoyosella subflava]AEF40130.1 Aminoglycoside phosphotransferase [Hoyosella subflava DQS3-9A1]
MSTDLLGLLPLSALAPALVAATNDTRWTEVDAELITGGKSNLTFGLSCPAGELILRRPPTGELLPRAHDMVREARVQEALAGTAVPTAAIVLVDDGNLLGFPFYVMEKVPGHVVRGDLPAGYATETDERRAIGEGFVDTLATLHAVDYEAIGLADYGRPEGFMARQVRRWTGQWEASRFEPVAEIEELGARLAAAVPAQQRTAIVHGDYRLDNVVLDSTAPGRIAAILDWELSTLGDPLTDLGLLLLFWREEGEPELSLIPGVSHLPGFPSRTQMLARYAETAGVDLSDMDWYLAFAHFKFAVIAQGVAARSRAGAMGGQDFGDLDAEILGLGQRGLALL